MDRTDGIGAPDGLGGPEHADARTAIVSALTGERVTDIEAAPNFKFRTSVPQVERLLYDAAGIPAGNLRDRRAPFMDWLDQQQAGSGAQTSIESTSRAEALNQEVERKLREAEATMASQNDANKDAPADEAQRVQAAIEGKGLLEAARFMTQSADSARAEVAGAVLGKLERLQAAGVELKLNIAHRGDMVPAPLHNGRGYTETGFDEKGRDIAVWLNGADVAGKVGTDEETLLHELVHAATTGMVFYGQQNPNTQAGQHVRDLMAVTDAIAAHISQRFEDADAGRVTLTEFEQDMRAGANNAFRNDDEVLAWALSSREAQTYLEGIPYRSGGSMWSRLVSAVRSLLGLAPQQDTALSEVLAVAERLMTSDAPMAGRGAFWHKRGMRMVQQQGRGSIVQSRRADGGEASAPVFSRDSAPAKQGITAESLPGIFAERFPKLAGAVRTMLDRGALGQKGGLVVLDSNDEATIAREFADRTGRNFDDTVQLFAGAGEDINAFYDPLSGITFMVGPNLSPSSMPSVVLHEMVHGQQRQALDQKAMALIEGRAKEAPALRAFLDRVAERMDTVGEEGNPFEATAYIVELATQEGRQAGFSRADGPMLAWVERNIGKGVADLVRDFVATVRAWAIAHGVELKNVAVDDLVAYAMAGVGKAARGRVVTSGESTKADGEGEGPAFSKGQATPAQSNPQQAGAWPIEPPDSKDKLIYTLQDKQIDTKRVVEAARKAGVSVTDAIDPYLQEELYHGRSAKRFNDFRNNELRPLLDSIRAAGLSLGDVENYLWASHARERNAQIAKVNDKMPDGGSGLTNAQADDLLAGRDVTVNGQVIRGVNQAKLADLQGIAKQVQAINATTRQMLVDSGMETPETIKAWEQAYANYVPLHREDVDQGGLGTGMGFSVRGASSKRAVGSGRTVVDILGNIANQRERQIARVEKNRVGQSVLGLVKAFPNKDFWTADTPPKVKTVESQTVFTAYDKAGNVLGKYSTQQQADKAHPSASVTIKRSTEDAVVERIDPTFRSKDEVFHVRVHGKDHFITFNSRDERAMRMVSALKNLDADQLGAVLQVTSKATRFFAAMATQYNPIWGVVNLTRDVQGALLNLSTTPLRGKEKEVFGHTLSALRGIYADLRAHRAGKSPSSKWASLFEEMQGEGGATGYKDMFVNAKDRTEAIERELDPTRWMQSPLGKIFTANGRLKVPLALAQKRAEGFFGWLSDFNETTENAIRLASYKTAIDSGMSKERAASIAKNISINFNRKGQVATQAGALYAFFNAAMQGTARLAETLRGPMGKKIIGGGIALGVMQAMMLAAAGMDDGEPPEFVKERGFIIPIGDGKYVSIPMPLGFHVLPSIGRIPAEYALSGFKDGSKRIADLFGLMADTFNPIGNAGFSLQTIAPTVIDPLAALAENKDWTGKQIAKEDMSSLHPTPGYLRAKDTASKMSRLISYYANAASGGTDFKPGLLSPTPDQLDYLIGQIAGGVGREALKIDQTVSSAVTGEDLPIHKVPLLGRFIGDTKGKSADSGKFYESLKRINQHQAELKGLREKGMADEAAEYLAENPEARLTLMANATERGLSELNRLKRKAIEAGDSDRVKQIESMAHERMRLFNERVASLEK